MARLAFLLPLYLLSFPHPSHGGIVESSSTSGIQFSTDAPKAELEPEPETEPETEPEPETETEQETEPETEPGLDWFLRKVRSFITAGLQLVSIVSRVTSIAYTNID